MRHRTAVRLLSLGVLLGLAATSAAGPPWFVTVGKITRVGTGYTGEGLYVTLDVPMQNAAPGCAQARTAFMPADATQYRETNAIVMLALAQARPISLFYDTTCHDPVAVVLAAVAIEIAP